MWSRVEIIISLRICINFTMYRAGCSSDNDGRKRKWKAVVVGNARTVPPLPIASFIRGIVVGAKAPNTVSEAPNTVLEQHQ